MDDKPDFRDLRVEYAAAARRLEEFGNRGPAAEVIAAEQAFIAAAVNLAAAVPGFMDELRAARNSLARILMRFSAEDPDLRGRFIDAVAALEDLI